MPLKCSSVNFAKYDITLHFFIIEYGRINYEGFFRKMSDIKIRKAGKSDIEILMKVRLEMLKIVNNLTDEYVYDGLLVEESRTYFDKGDQTTVLAFDGDDVIGCASISYIWIMPTFSHPTGKRAHLMNVYTRKEYRGRGIAKKMIRVLIDEAREKGCTEISLDATEMGRPLYESLGFTASSSGMCMNL